MSQSLTEAAYRARERCATEQWREMWQERGLEIEARERFPQDGARRIRFVFWSIIWGRKYFWKGTREL